MKNENNNPEQESNEMPVFMPDNLKAASFTNSAFAQFTGEEFSIDFLNMGALGHAVVSRGVMTPSHMKRLALLLNSKVGEYEEMFGEIPQLIEPKK